MAFYEAQRKLLTRIGQLGKNSLKLNLQRLGKVASGETANSVNFKIDFSLKKSSVSISANESIIFIHHGRVPGAKMPPTKPIEKWIMDKGIRNTQLPLQVQAFLIARKIGRDGIKPTFVISETFASDRFKDEVANMITTAALEDIKNEIKVSLSDSFKKT